MNRYNLQEKKKMSGIKDERDDMTGVIRYIKFSGDYDNFMSVKIR